MRRTALVLTAAAAVAAAAAVSRPAEALAIPAFARAYDTACSTCHTVVPRRNEFGEAFRRAGFRWPTRPETDSEAQSPPPQELRGVGLLDGMLPSELPLAAVGTLAASVQIPGAEPIDHALSLGQPALSLLFGAPFGEHLSVFGSWSTVGAPDQLYVQATRLLGRPELNARVGKLEQSTTLFRPNQALLAPYLLSDASIDGHVVGVGRLGAEVYSVLWDRVQLTAGAVLNGDLGSNVDTYYQVAAAIGGPDLSGRPPDVDLDDPSVFDDVSLTVAHWGYLGRVSGPDGTTVSGIRRLGLDGILRFRELSLHGGAMLGVDRDRLDQRDVLHLTVLGEASYSIFSWLIPVYLFQVQDSARQEALFMTHDAGVIVLLLENLRARAAFHFSDDGVDNELVDLQLLVAL